MLSSKTFDYNAAKKDQLAVYNGSMLTYDANGCLKTAPGTVMNTSGTVTYGWTGGRLTSASWGSNPLNACTYAYDGYGRRINKTHTVTVLGGSIPSQTIKSTGYTYDQGGRLICERISTSSTAGSISTEEKLYLYDEASVVGMIYTANGTTNTYYFDKDVFGNVLGIHNAQGIQQCRYVYDAFGNCKVLNPDGTVNISSTFIGNINPFRYKGYYYDKETCLYYLGTRYYCPDLCRFIQPADVSSLIPSTVNGLNLYAFANNNPVVIAYRSSGSGANGGMVSSIASSVGGLNSGYHGAISNSSKWHFDPNFLTEAFGYIENGFSIIEGALTGYRNVKHLPQLESLSKISKKLMIGGIVLGLVVDAHNNFSNEQLSFKEQIIGFAVDGLYTVGSAALSYGISSLVTAGLALIPGVGLFAVLGGALMSIGVMEIIDRTVEEYGWLDSIKDWIEGW